MTALAAALPPQRDEPPVVPSGAPTPPGYASLPEFLALPGMTYRKLDYWSRVGILRPVNPAAGSGVKRLWPRDELGVAMAVCRLLDAGFSLNVARDVARHRRPGPGAFEVIASPADGLRLVVTDELWTVPG